MKIAGRTNVFIVQDILLIQDLLAIVAPRPETGHRLLFNNWRYFCLIFCRKPLLTKIER
jgi:hypothetical protein